MRVGAHLAWGKVTTVSSSIVVEVCRVQRIGMGALDGGRTVQRRMRRRMGVRRLRGIGGRLQAVRGGVGIGTGIEVCVLLHQRTGVELSYSILLSEA